METRKKAVIGYYAGSWILSQGKKKVIAFLKNKTNIHARILFTLADYLKIYSKRFDRVRYLITDEIHKDFPNGTITGIIGRVNRSEIDIGVQPVTMNEENTEIVDFAFPYKLYTSTFVTRKAEYKPQTFGIFQTFSLPLWIAIIAIIIAISLVYYVTLKRRYSFDKILFHVFAVLLRQNSILKPSSMIKKLLFFSWIVGAMFLCLAYDSVFPSFLSFPTITQVKDVQQLAKAVEEGHYHCISPSRSYGRLLKSKEEHFKIIGRDLNTNNLSTENNFGDFLYGKNKQNLALIVDTDVTNIFTVGTQFISEDRFLEGVAAMPVRKDFCCIKLIEKFIHRLMASGLFFKYKNDKAFLMCLPRLLEYKEKYPRKRILTFTHIVPAFIFVIFGHLISFLVLIVEILSNRKKRVDILKKNKNREMKTAFKEGFRELSLKIEW